MVRSLVIRVLTITALGLLCLDTLSPALCFSDARQQGTALCRLLLQIQRRVAGEGSAESESSPTQYLTRHKPEESLRSWQEARPTSESTYVCESRFPERLLHDTACSPDNSGRAFAFESRGRMSGATPNQILPLAG
jgi:hypothetical protein